MWPRANQHIIQVANEHYREWDETSIDHFQVAQTIPAAIAELTLPIAQTAIATEPYIRAMNAVQQLANKSLAADAPQLSHLVAVLVRSDAIASSRIEQVHASSEELAVVLADLDEQGDAIASPDAQETQLVAGAVEAVQDSIDGIGTQATQDWFKALHTSLLRADATIERNYLGQWRDCPVWIGPSRQNAEFEGPPHEQVPDLMEDLIRFIGRHDVPDLTRAAIAHAQFETIHPFVDGNGRIGRALIHRIIGAPNVPVPVAHGLLSDLPAYIEGLNAYRAGSLEVWLASFYAAVERGAIAACSLLDALRNLRLRFHQLVPTRSGSATRQLLDDLVGQPVITSLIIQRNYGVTAARASQLTAQLTKSGILRRSNVWAPTSQRIWVAQDVLATIDSLGEHLPRQVD